MTTEDIKAFAGGGSGSVQEEVGHIKGGGDETFAVGGVGEV